MDTKDWNWYTRPDDDQRGVTLEVDLEYLDESLAPKNIEVTEDRLSPYCKDRQIISSGAAQ